LLVINGIKQNQRGSYPLFASQGFHAYFFQTRLSTPQLRRFTNLFLKEVTRKRVTLEIWDARTNQNCYFSFIYL